VFLQVCHAIQHAHTKGVIHRDIKPNNVLVSTHDGRPLVKVIDFGVAKATQSPLTDKTLVSMHRQPIGTPAYMSPEQAEGSLDIDTRTDVYALGAVLYELLSGATPFDARTLLRAGYVEMLRIIRESEPPAPSTRLSRLRELQPPGTGVSPSDSTSPMTGPSEPRTSASGPLTAELAVDSTADIAAYRRSDLGSLIRMLRGDLDWI